MKTPLLKRTLAVSALLLAAPAFVACGGDDSASDDGGSGDSGSSAAEGGAPTTEEFCDSYTSIVTDIATSGAEPDVASIKSAMADFGDGGIPDDAPDDVKDGFDVFISTWESIPDDATTEDLLGIGQGLSADDQAAGTAFTTWVDDTCGSGLPSESPTS